MKKSSRHSKITGDFSEAIVLYWLSKHGYECAKIDHTGIDLIARPSSSTDVWGISVKSRSRYVGTEGISITIPIDGFKKAELACRAFKCIPFYAIVVDGGSKVRCFVMSLDVLKEHVTGGGDENRYWNMSQKYLDQYGEDTRIMRFQLNLEHCSWEGQKSAGGELME